MPGRRGASREERVCRGREPGRTAEPMYALAAAVSRVRDSCSPARLSRQGSVSSICVLHSPLWMLSAADRGMWGPRGGLVAAQEVGSPRAEAARAADGAHRELAGNDVPTDCEGPEQLTLIQRGTGSRQLMTKSCISFLLHRTGTVAGPLVSSECSQGGWRGTMEMGETQITQYTVPRNNLVPSFS